MSIRVTAPHRWPVIYIESRFSEAEKRYVHTLSSGNGVVLVRWASDDEAPTENDVVRELREGLARRP